MLINKRDDIEKIIQDEINEYFLKNFKKPKYIILSQLAYNKLEEVSDQIKYHLDKDKSHSLLFTEYQGFKIAILKGCFIQKIIDVSG